MKYKRTMASNYQNSGRYNDIVEQLDPYEIQKNHGKQLSKQRTWFDKVMIKGL